MWSETSLRAPKHLFAWIHRKSVCLRGLHVQRRSRILVFHLSASGVWATLGMPVSSASAVAASAWRCEATAGAGAVARAEGLRAGLERGGGAGPREEPGAGHVRRFWGSGPCAARWGLRISGVIVALLCGLAKKRRSRAAEVSPCHARGWRLQNGPSGSPARLRRRVSRWMSAGDGRSTAAGSRAA